MKHTLKDQFLSEYNSLLNGYPKFVYSKNNLTSWDGIPVFVYHTIDPQLFEKHLQHIVENGYHTLSIHDFSNLINNGGKLDRPSILLTIDDARLSVWKYAYPLLKKYNLRATVFAIPGITQDENKLNLTLEDYWNNKCSVDDVRSSDPNDDTLCNWLEIEEMYGSGHIDIESHTLFHSEVFCSRTIVDFISPSAKQISYGFIGSPYFNRKDIGKPVNFDEYIGLPLFKSAPTMVVGPRLNISDEFISFCKGVYKKHKSDVNKWHDEIRKAVAELFLNSLKLDEESYEHTKQDLKLAREIIQSKLDTNAGNHLCLPWTKGNEKTITICEELGIKSCFWGLLQNKKINKPGDNIYYITRLKNDFLFRLPGKGRKGLFSIYFDKVKRRSKGEKIF